MYNKVRLADTVRIAPELLGDDVTNAVRIALIDSSHKRKDFIAA